MYSPNAAPRLEPSGSCVMKGLLGRGIASIFLGATGCLQGALRAPLACLSIAVLPQAAVVRADAGPARRRDGTLSPKWRAIGWRTKTKDSDSANQASNLLSEQILVPNIAPAVPQGVPHPAVGHRLRLIHLWFPSYKSIATLAEHSVCSRLGTNAIFCWKPQRHPLVEMETGIPILSGLCITATSQLL